MTFQTKYLSAPSPYEQGVTTFYKVLTNGEVAQVWLLHDGSWIDSGMSVSDLNRHGFTECSVEDLPEDIRRSELAIVIKSTNLLANAKQGDAALYWDWFRNCWLVLLVNVGRETVVVYDSNGQEVFPETKYQAARSLITSGAARFIETQGSREEVGKAVYYMYSSPKINGGNGRQYRRKRGTNQIQVKSTERPVTWHDSELSEEMFNALIRQSLIVEGAHP